MRKVSNRSRSNSRSGDKSESSSIRDNTEKYTYIKSANRKLRLLDILRHYGIRIEKNHQRPTWSNNITCPLPTHKGAKERTPSFGYCFVSDHFSCFGCRKAGRAVEFISLYEGVPRTAIAERILSQYGEDVSTEDYEDYKDDLTPILVEGSSFFQELIQNYKDNPKVLHKIDKVIWWLDFYLMTKVPGHKVNAEELEYRIARAKELLRDETFTSK